MKTSIKKIKFLYGPAEWLIIVNGKTIGVVFAKVDAKLVAKCIRKYRK